MLSALGCIQIMYAPIARAGGSATDACFVLWWQLWLQVQHGDATAAELGPQQWAEQLEGDLGAVSPWSPAYYLSLCLLVPEDLGFCGRPLPNFWWPACILMDWIQRLRGLDLAFGLSDTPYLQDP